MASRRRTAHHGLDHDGYIRSESEERIAGGSNGWGDKSLAEGDVELAHANPGFDTNVVGGRNGAPVWEMPMQGAGVMDDKDRIVKTVHINQFSEND